MAAHGVNIVDDLVTRLAAPAIAYTTSFTPTKQLFQHSLHSALSGVQVTVSTGDEEAWERNSRGGAKANWLKEWEAVIRIAAPSNDTTDLETYMLLTQEIKEDLCDQKMDGMTLDSIDQPDQFDIDRLHTAAEFLAVVTLTYKGF